MYMIHELWNYHDYRKYIHSVISNSPNQGHGMISLFAKKMGCRPSYVTQVINGKCNLSAEQSYELSMFLKHSDEETDYFSLLVQLARAGTPSLQIRLRKKIQSMRESNLSLSKQAKSKGDVSKEFAQVYYSNWIYSAVHILATIPAHATEKGMARYLGVSIKQIRSILLLLTSAGLIRKENEKIKVTNANFFLSSSSPLILNHHQNWRIKVMESMKPASLQEVHLSTVLSMSKDDIEKLRTMTIDFIQKFRKQAKESKEEELVVLFLDLQKLGYQE